ncbi:unnamed protein product [[Candida] boidinii]|uniref:Unnamed protein product n=1 Tax=Candida boidinii TaxID=5477 RepID=A0A9W6WGP9_CANBO|nr:unnamed protein product [[Candida] boidinii]GMG03647.1 unnamed protein product [[Candida] boidinii]
MPIEQLGNESKLRTTVYTIDNLQASRCNLKDFTDGGHTIQLACDQQQQQQQQQQRVGWPQMDTACRTMACCVPWKSAIVTSSAFAILQSPTDQID